LPYHAAKPRIEVGTQEGGPVMTRAAKYAIVAFVLVLPACGDDATQESTSTTAPTTIQTTATTQAATTTAAPTTTAAATTTQAPTTTEAATTTAPPETTDATGE
jgi:hypothetical protein